MKARDYSIDVLRGIAIIFVIFGHVTRDMKMQEYIWVFHLPIFFFISGVLYNPVKYRNTLAFVKSKFTSLILPYIFFYLFTLVYWILIERHVRGAELTICSQFLGLFYGTYSLDYMYFNGALWFIPCLFSIELIYRFVGKLRRWWLIVLIVLIMNASGLLFMDVIRYAPFGINAALIATCFYAFGHLIKDKIKNFANKYKVWLPLLIIMCVGLQFFLTPLTGKADLAALEISARWLYIPVGIVGIVLYFLLATIVKRNIILEWLGRNSLVLFALQEPVYRAIIFLGTKVTNIDTDLFRQNIICTVITTILTITIISPMVLLYNQWINPYFKSIGQKPE